MYVAKLTWWGAHNVLTLFFAFYTGHVQVSHVNLVWPQLRNVLLYIVVTVVTILQLMQFNSSSYFYSYCHDILK